MTLRNSDFWILAALMSGFGGLGVWEGYEVHPVFYSQSAVIFGFTGYFGYQILHADRIEAQKVVSRSISSEDLHSG